jgi:hypothetical protein
VVTVLGCTLVRLRWARDALFAGGAEQLGERDRICHRLVSGGRLLRVADSVAADPCAEN